MPKNVKDITIAELEMPGFENGRPLAIYAAAFAAPLKNASRSALIVSASVVGMP